nr:hypothetical protein [Lachnospiraceae bacterium]
EKNIGGNGKSSIDVLVSFLDNPNVRTKIKQNFTNNSLLHVSNELSYIEDTIKLMSDEEKKKVYDEDPIGCINKLKELGFCNLHENDLLRVAKGNAEGKSPEYLFDGTDYNAINMNNVDRDRLTEQDVSDINYVLGFSSDYRDDLNKYFDFAERFSNANTEEEKNNIITECDRQTSLSLNLNRDELNKMWQKLYSFNKNLKKDVCKLGTDEKPILINPLGENKSFSSQFRKKESDVLEICSNMLSEADSHVKMNSSEYNSIKKAVSDAKKLMDKDYSDKGTARKNYLDSITDIMNKINIYRLHKARKGIKDDGTRYKLMAVERIDKLLNTRYKSLTGKDYSTNIKGNNSFDPKKDLDVTNQIDSGLTGDAYVLACAKQKISNINKAIKNISEAPKAENNNVKLNPVEFKGINVK